MDDISPTFSNLESISYCEPVETQIEPDINAKFT